LVNETNVLSDSVSPGNFFREARPVVPLLRPGELASATGDANGRQSAAV